jgi:hypothetical protein
MAEGAYGAVVLLPKPFGSGWMEQQLVHALTDLRIRVRKEVRLDASVFGHHVVPPSSVRNVPPPVRPTYIRRGSPGSS